MHKRLKLLLFFFFTLFFLIESRLFYWQVVKHGKLSAVASKQYSNFMEIPAERGKIFSSDNYPLVLNQNDYLLFIDPSLLKVSPSELAEKLSFVLGKENVKKTKELLANGKDSFYVPLARGITADQKKRLTELKITNLGFENQEKRFYPEASMSAQLLGFVGEGESNNKNGYFGLEGYYDKELKGRAGVRRFEQDALGRPLPLSEVLEEKPLPGRDLVLNIDRSLEFLVEKKLKMGMEKYGARSGLVVVMNPASGAVLAMSSFPNYDPGKYYLFNSDYYRNPVISSSFEPGSIFKTIVMAAALDAKAVTPYEKCTDCGGPKNITGYTIKTWNEKYFPDSTITDILVHSDNVGMVYVIEKLGKDKFYEYLEKFGFGRKTGIDLQGEESPILRNKKQLTKIDMATISFGQGIAVTPIQMLTAVSAIANKGELVKPQVVEKIVEKESPAFTLPIHKSRVLSEQAAQEMKEMMVQAVERGEAKWARPPNYKIAGKTGTAQIPVAGNYDPDKTIVSFIGFAPADDPKFAMLVCLTEPKTSPWGSETAAPLWFELSNDIFKLWNIKPNQ